MTAPTAVIGVLSAALLFGEVQQAAVDEQVLRNAINELGDFDYATRTAASSIVRRTPAEQARPTLAGPSRLRPRSLCDRP